MTLGLNLARFKGHFFPFITKASRPVLETLKRGNPSKFEGLPLFRVFYANPNTSTTNGQKCPLYPTKFMSKVSGSPQSVQFLLLKTQLKIKFR